MVLMTATCAVEGAPKPELAQKFVAHLLSPAVQVAFSTYYGSGPTNKEVKLSEDVAKRVIYGEDQVKQLVTMDWDAINKNRTEWTRRWQREVER